MGLCGAWGAVADGVGQGWGCAHPQALGEPGAGRQPGRALPGCGAGAPQGRGRWHGGSRPCARSRSFRAILHSSPFFVLPWETASHTVRHACCHPPSTPARPPQAATGWEPGPPPCRLHSAVPAAAWGCKGRGGLSCIFTQQQHLSCSQLCTLLRLPAWPLALRHTPHACVCVCVFLLRVVNPPFDPEQPATSAGLRGRAGWRPAWGQGRCRCLLVGSCTRALPGLSPARNPIRCVCASGPCPILAVPLVVCVIGGQAAPLVGGDVPAAAASPAPAGPVPCARGRPVWVPTTPRACLGGTQTLT